MKFTVLPLLCCLISACSTFGSITESSENFNPVYYEAVGLMKANNFSAAIMVLKESIKDLKDGGISDTEMYEHVCTLAVLGEAYFYSSSYEDAIIRLEKGIDLHVEYIIKKRLVLMNMHQTLGYSLSENGKPNEAVPHIEIAMQIAEDIDFINIDEKSPYFLAKMYHHNSLIYEDTTEMEKAGDSLNKGIDVKLMIGADDNSFYGDNYIKVYKYYYNAGKSENSLIALEKAITNYKLAGDKTPELAEAYYFKGMTLNITESIKLAMPSYIRCLELFEKSEPDYYSMGAAAYNVAMVYEDESDLKTSERYFIDAKYYYQRVVESIMDELMKDPNHYEHPFYKELIEKIGDCEIGIKRVLTEEVWEENLKKITGILLGYLETLKFTQFQDYGLARIPVLIKALEMQGFWNKATTFSLLVFPENGDENDKCRAFFLIDSNGTDNFLLDANMIKINMRDLNQEYLEKAEYYILNQFP